MVFVAVVVHAMRLLPNCNTTADFDEAYGKTNGMAVIDGILEMPLASRFGGKWFVVGAYSIFGLTLLPLLWIPFEPPPTYVPDDNPVDYVYSTLTAVLLAISTMYRFTADICEYRIFTLPKNLNKETNSPNHLNDLSDQDDITHLQDEADSSVP